jgi:phosphonate transport system substrate-binding protein
VLGGGLTVAWLLVAVFCGCDSDDREPPYEPSFAPAPKVGHAGVEYTFGVFPLHNAVRLFQVYQPALDAVNASVDGFVLRLQAGKDYRSYEQKLRDKSLAFAVVNPYQAIRAERSGYRIFAKMGGDSRMRGILVVRKDGRVRSFADLPGARISFPARSATAATMMNKVFLKKNGVDVERDMTAVYVGSQDSAVMNVFLGKTDLGGTWPPTWDALAASHPEVVRALEVRWQTESTVSLAVVARADVPDTAVARVADGLVALEHSAQGRRALAAMGIPRYERADTRTYDPFRAFLTEYEQLFGALPEDGM